MHCRGDHGFGASAVLEVLEYRLVDSPGTNVAEAYVICKYCWGAVYTWLAPLYYLNYIYLYFNTVVKIKS